MFRYFLVISSLLVSTGSVNGEGPSRKLLFLGDQNSHKPALRFEIIQPVMAERGIELTYTEDVNRLNARSLNQFDGLVLYANIDTIAPEQAQALLDYVASGKGFVPIHCATFCFRNSPEVVALMGAQFKRHGRGEMTTQPAGVQHPIMEGYETFTSWDETYVHHLHNEKNRVVLEYRAGDMQAGGNVREPWTWIRTHGDGRVFYTAWGHDERTWSQPGFHDLVERGIRWACGEGETGMSLGSGLADAGQFSMPAMKSLPEALKPFDYSDVGPEIPNYAAGQGKTLNLMQTPVPAAESMQHIVTPTGFHVELFADESMPNGMGDGGKLFDGKPIAMNWDEWGRLWICETVDYPNELHEESGGRDHVRVLTDVDGDGKVDKSTIFATGLSIPTAIAFHRGGIVVQNGMETLYLKDTDGDDRADVRHVLISDWNLGDTHGGVSNFRNGLDNWIWAMQGYNNSSPTIDGEELPAFRMGFFRFRLSQDDHPRVEELEFVRSTTNNTWGLGISEEGLIFGSTANRQPSFFMPIANRYYERVKGWAPERLEMICEDHLFEPITDKIRQVDHHGGYTAAAGHALYTARNYPVEWWNRTAFVCGPTGKLVGTFVIDRDGAGMKSDSPMNLFASDDEWTAPIMAEVGPDGNVWVLDWYNYIVQHNPTPQGFKTGKGRAYETKLRDSKYGRIYRVVPDVDNALTAPIPREAAAAELVRYLASDTMQVRLSAQRLLVEGGNPGVAQDLIALIEDPTVDAIGLNVAAIHALNTVQGLGLLETDSPALKAVTNALAHPSAGVRLNAVRVMPENATTLAALQAANLMADKDDQVLLATLLKISDIPGGQAGLAMSNSIDNPTILSDRWLTDALTSAAAMHAESFLTSLLMRDTVNSSSHAIIQRVAEHFARERPTKDSVTGLLSAMARSRNNAGDAVIAGLTAGWPGDYVVALDASVDDDLRAVFAASTGSGKASLARLATSWSNRSLEKEIAPIMAAFVDRIENGELSVDERLAAANELIRLDPSRLESVDALERLVGPQSPASLSIGLIQAMNQSKGDGLAERFVRINQTATPALRSEVIRVMLTRPELTRVLLSTIEAGDLQISDLSTEQRGGLASHPSIEIRRATRRLLQASGVAIDNNRTRLVASKMPLTQRTGDPQLGKALFTKHCAACHVFKGEGGIVGPNLNGMSVHPKSELLTHILDPNRSVEANFRLYTVLTADGLVVSGLLAAESLTSIEVVDAQGKRHAILREDIDELLASKSSAMPEGFEQSIDDDGFVNLLEYLTQHEQFIPLGLENVANAVSTQGMFVRRDNDRERLVLPQWGLLTFDGVPFMLIDPQGTKVKNAIMLNGPLGPFAPEMPATVSIRCRMSARTIHLLGGVAGWASQTPREGEVSMIVRLRYADGQSEDHPLIDGQHIADYIGVFHVPESKFAFETQNGGQLRYLAIKPKRDALIETVDLVKPAHRSAPVVMAMTVELQAAIGGHQE